MHICYLGAASPQAVKKLLSLSEQSKPRQKSQHPSLERDGGSQSGSRSDVAKLDRADQQPTPVNLTSESSSVTGRPKENKAPGHIKVKVRKMQNSIGSVTSTDSGYGQGFERLDRNHSESPQLPPRRRYQHYHRQHHHG